MSYAVVEAAAVTVLRKHADFDATNCRAGDVSPIKKGLERVVSALYGGVRKDDLTVTMVRHTWTVFLDLYVPYRGEVPELETRLASERQKMIDTVEAYPMLDGTAGVTKAHIINGETPEPLQPKKGAYRGQRLYLEVTEIVKPARQE